MQKENKRIHDHSNKRQSGSKSSIMISGKQKVCMSSPLFPLTVKNGWLDNEYVHNYYLITPAEDTQVWVAQESHHLTTKAMDVIPVVGLCNFGGSSKLDLDYKLPVVVVCSSIALSHSNHNILVSCVFYEEYIATILLVLLWQQTTVLSNCDATYNVICVFQYGARGLHSTAK